jgi:hypothetical protein
MKYQNYAKFLIPITFDPNSFGKVIEHSGNKFINQLSTGNTAIITQYNNENFIRIFRKGELVLEFKDHKIDDSTF